MGGSLDKVHAIETMEKAEEREAGEQKETREDSQMKALVALREVYEGRIRDIKESSAEHVQSLKRDKKILTLAVCILTGALVGILVLDLLVGSIGWIRY